eukprot:TRINITY_DN1829_c0_g1_i2.p2 TRINITY_DN1829_c0_g1~~TRINITY_DN1829_c0_g1_i2.p2  ORF type:complete len:164 (+),score=24.52 TRINITY_DN1829_c0_g1_i2:377-868(+)
MVHYNSCNDSLLFTAGRQHDHYSSLRFRAVSIPNLLKREPRAHTVMPSERMRNPSWAEVDDSAGKLLTFNGYSMVYKVWDLVTYEQLFTMSALGVQRITVSSGVVVVGGLSSKGVARVKVVDACSGKVPSASGLHGTHVRRHSPASALLRTASSRSWTSVTAK